jgi:hypothetical protein
MSSGLDPSVCSPPQLASKSASEDTRLLLVLRFVIAIIINNTA